MYTKADLVDMKTDADFFAEVLKGKLILIAYDTDVNYEPCNKGGVKAHWTLITGFLVPIEFRDTISKSVVEHTDDNRPVGINFIRSLRPGDSDALKAKYESSNEFRSLIYVTCKQGKSKKLGVWKLAKLLESNRQLKEINSSKCDPLNFVLPADGDLSKSLSLRFLVFK